jgi:hypothetical protein
VFLRGVHYDPLTGQFLQRDPDGYIASVNAYAGFANNPVGMRDPLGRNPARQFKSIGILDSGVFDGIKHRVPSEASRIAQVASADTVIKQAQRQAGNAAQGIANVNDTARILDKDSARLPSDLDPHLATESGSVRVPQADPTLVDQSVRPAPVALPDDSTVIRGAPVGLPSPAARLDASINRPAARAAPAAGVRRSARPPSCRQRRLGRIDDRRAPRPSRRRADALPRRHAQPRRGDRGGRLSPARQRPERRDPRDGREDRARLPAGHGFDLGRSDHRGGLCG